MKKLKTIIKIKNIEECPEIDGEDEEFYYYIVKKGDSLAKIAKDFYREEKLWQSLLKDNKEIIEDPKKYIRDKKLELKKMFQFLKLLNKFKFEIISLIIPIIIKKIMNNTEEPLKMPRGSIRAIITIMITITVLGSFFLKYECPDFLIDIWVFAIGYYIGYRTDSNQVKIKI